MNASQTARATPDVTDAGRFSCNQAQDMDTAQRSDSPWPAAYLGPHPHLHPLVHRRALPRMPAASRQQLLVGFARSSSGLWYLLGWLGASWTLNRDDTCPRVRLDDKVPLGEFSFLDRGKNPRSKLWNAFFGLGREARFDAFGATIPKWLDRIERNLAGT
jgi:hypothetical protein